MNNDMDKIGTDQAKLERKNQQEMAKADHERILGDRMKEQISLAKEEPDWSLFNYIMSTVSFEKENMQTGMHKMFRHLWPHIKRYHNERAQLILSIDNNECRCMGMTSLGPSPLEMAQNSLERVREAAKIRSKLNSYGVILPKKKIII